MGGASSWLVGDIGGTNARFALFAASACLDEAAIAAATYATRDFPGPAEAARRFLDDCGASPEAAAIAVAGPVTGDRVTLTNESWQFSCVELGRALNVERLEVVNDLAAVALALPDLPVDGSRALRATSDRPERAAMVVLGVGTGLGISAVVPDRGGDWVAVPGEGGHAALPAADKREAAVIERIRARFGHVSAERALSGPGLVNLAHAVAELDDLPIPPDEPAAVVAAADGGCQASGQALHLFAAMLGGVAGDAALIFGARGGVFLSGGVVPRLGSAFDVALFHRRFAAKGRFSGYLGAIPTRLITTPEPAFRGLRRLLSR